MCYHVDIKMFVQITLLLLVSLTNYFITSDMTASLRQSKVVMILRL